MEGLYYMFLSEVRVASEVTGSGTPQDVGDPWCDDPAGKEVPGCDHTMTTVGLFDSDSQF